MGEMVVCGVRWAVVCGGDGGMWGEVGSGMWGRWWYVGEMVVCGE